MRAGDFAVITTHQRKVISSLVNKCSFCMSDNSSEKSYIKFGEQVFILHV
jgi:hypothetical protein